MLSGMYMYSFYGLNLTTGLGQSTKSRFLEFLCSHWRHLPRCQGSQRKAIMVPFKASVEHKNFLKSFS